jgi:hypothetical protein
MWNFRSQYEDGGMLVALLAVLGVDLIVIVVVAAVLLSRRVWVSRQPGAFKGAIRVAEGRVPGLRPKWKRGFGRWAGEVLVWSKAPMLFRNELVVAGGIAAEVRTAGPDDKVRRLGHEPVIVPVRADEARIEIAAPAEKSERALGPFAGPADAGSRGRHGRPGAGIVTGI